MARRGEKSRLGEIGCLELPCALFDLALQRGIRFLQAGGHLVELIAQRLELVAGLDRNALTKIAAADPRSAVVQCANWYHHAARQEQACEQREHERREK